MIRIGVDVGGTFTDLVAVDEEGRLFHAKAPSTPADQSLGVLEGLARLAETMGLDRRTLLERTERIVHGTTVATNALLERKGAKVGLLTTEGHRDVLEMREGLKDDRYDLRQPPPEPLVPRRLRLGVRERMRADGRVEIPLDRASLVAAIERLRAEKVESVAVCYLHAWRDAAHERATREELARLLPHVPVSLSSEVWPQIKEFERVSTTVVNAYVQPALARYLGRLEERLRASGYSGPLLVMTSHGGLATVEEIVRLAAGAVLSGPAGGIAAAVRAARASGIPDLVPFDMGGTSTDIALVRGGRAAIATDRKFAGQRIALPSLDIVSIGAGGGSIARLDPGGILQVGPESAGADPGPACYGRGGVHATVTDADLLLGYLDPERFAGGRMRLDRGAAERAVGRLAQELGCSLEEAAAGIQRVIDAKMADGVRIVSVRRGVDPRGFALLAFGGAAGLHASAVARALGMTRILVPRLASVLSAYGMLASDLRIELSRSHVAETHGLAADELRALFASLEAEGRARLAATGFSGRVRVHRVAEMRYGEQIFEVPVDLDAIPWEAPDLLDRIAASFHDRHEELYTYALRDRAPVLVNLRVAVVGELEAVPEEPPRPAGTPVPPFASRRIFLEGWCEAPVFAFDALVPGQVIDGPALVESATTTVLLRPGDRARVTDRGWLDATLPPPRGAESGAATGSGH
ncbi:MAG: hydantoinase/oxoprolinase family protein [Geminicoccaceae bacterium]|nr:hydantoinase/oxoprolinase family protein [Geminicoccaceae bacterium]MCS7267363.1 hydantoinase/oxoprolinase family protein [Geminicoccaceae bacterium]MCX7630300.1 hydantoinase/oxoprolinase family protein [Geminicoccaceae bacterium]MDW8123586.1 hydantoinase/oxoprolinase family protein [Geminicoccaceae bacterium]MDW8339927.1 hydantoinase/oxoprolinase family protein [Geminicoccaceae bacterium]